MAVGPLCSNQTKQQVRTRRAQAVPHTSDAVGNAVGSAANHDTGAQMCAQVRADNHVQLALSAGRKKVVKALRLLGAAPTNVEYPEHVND